MLFLLLGAVINICVAWGCVLGSGDDGQRTMRLMLDVTFDGDNEISKSEAMRVVHAVMSSPPKLQQDACESGFTDDSYFGGVKANFAGETLTAVGSYVFWPHWGIIESQAGWPCRSMVAYYCYGDITGRDHGEVGERPKSYDDWSFPVPKLIGRGDMAGRGEQLPLLPLWPGFAVNTLSYAFVLWITFQALLILRREIRRRHGHCLKCGYDLRGDFQRGCPECGWNRSDAPA